MFSPSFFFFPLLSFPIPKNKNEASNPPAASIHAYNIYMSTKSHIPGTAHPPMLVGSWKNDGKRVRFPPSEPNVWALQCRAQIWMSTSSRGPLVRGAEIRPKDQFMKEGHDQFPTGVSLEGWTENFPWAEGRSNRWPVDFFARSVSVTYP